MQSFQGSQCNSGLQDTVQQEKKKKIISPREIIVLPDITLGKTCFWSIVYIGDKPHTMEKQSQILQESTAKMRCRIPPWLSTRHRIQAPAGQRSKWNTQNKEVFILRNLHLGFWE